MDFNEEQKELMKKIGISIDFSAAISDSDCCMIEDKVSAYLQQYGLEDDKITKEGKICESILDML